MKGIVLNYRRGKHTQNVNQVLIELDGISTKEEARKFLHKTVGWKSPSGKLFRGKIISVHGNKGIVRAKFEKNLPGQSFGSKIEVLEK